jgi:hypothetical protein
MMVIMSAAIIVMSVCGFVCMSCVIVGARAEKRVENMFIEDIFLL